MSELLSRLEGGLEGTEEKSSEKAPLEYPALEELPNETEG